MLEATQTSQLLHSALAGWRGTVLAVKQAESFAIMMLNKRAQR